MKIANLIEAQYHEMSSTTSLGGVKSQRHRCRGLCGEKREVGPKSTPPTRLSRLSGGPTGILERHRSLQAYISIIYRASQAAEIRSRVPIVVGTNEIGSTKSPPDDDLSGHRAVDVRGHESRWKMGDADQEDSRWAVGKEVRGGAELKGSWIVGWPPRTAQVQFTTLLLPPNIVVVE